MLQSLFGRKKTGTTGKFRAEKNVKLVEKKFLKYNTFECRTSNLQLQMRRVLSGGIGGCFLSVFVMGKILIGVIGREFL